jgi:hypothetical protein
MRNHAQSHRQPGLRRHTTGSSVRKSESDYNHLTTPGGKSIITCVSKTAWRIIAHGLRAKIERVRTPGAYIKPAKKAHQPILLECEEPFCRQRGLDQNFPSLSHMHPVIRLSECAPCGATHGRPAHTAMMQVWQGPAVAFYKEQRALRPGWRELVVCRPSGFWQERRGSGAWLRCEVRWVFAKITCKATGAVPTSTWGAGSLA